MPRLRRPEWRLRGRNLPRTALLIAGIAFVNFVIWALVTPPFEGPDEYAHVSYAVDLAERGKAPTPTSKGQFASSEMIDALDATSSFALIRSNASRPPWTDSTRRGYEALVARTQPARDNGGGGNITSSTHGPVYYFFAALGYLIAGGSFFTRLFGMRVASALLGAIAAACVYGTVRELIPRSRWPAIAAGLLVAFEPMFGFISGVVNADNGINCAAAALMFVLVRGMRRGFTLGVAAALPVVFVLGVFAKATMLALAPALALGLLFALFRRRLGIRGIVMMAGSFVGIMLVWALVAHLVGRPFLHLPNTPGPGAVGGTSATLGDKLSYIWQVFLPPLPGMTDLYIGPGRVPAYTIYLKEIWGTFGWVSLPFPERVFKVILAVLAALAALGIVTLVRERKAVRDRLPELIVLAVAAIGVSVSVHLAFLRTAPFAANIGEQGRYMFPAITTAAVFGIGACYGVGRRYAPVLATGLVTAMMLLSFGAQLFVFAGYFT
jgi:hypothetical protein